MCKRHRSTGRVGKGTQGASSSLRRLQLRLPVWLMHNETGAPDGMLQKLADKLSQPCYGLAMPQDADQLQSMADLARTYVKSVKVAQPVGPYLLVGCSVFGSLLASVMVSQLER